MKSPRLEPYKFSTYRDFLKASLDLYLADGESYRSLAKQFGIGSPNFFQQILAGHRNLTPRLAKDLGAKMGLANESLEYFVLLVKLESPRYHDKEKALTRLQIIHKNLSSREISDASIHSHWLHPVVFEVAAIPGFDMSIGNLKKRLQSLATSNEIEESMAFLVKRGFLIATGNDNQYKQAQVKFSVFDDVRRLEIQRSHLRFLDIAKHRFNDDTSRREFRGLTVAVNQEQIKDLKVRLRDFYKQLNAELSATPKPDRIIRLQTCLFMLADCSDHDDADAKVSDQYSSESD